VHEASLIRDLMQKIVKLAAAEGAARVVRVDVWLGALSHLSADHFREHFAQAAGGTIAEGASLDVLVSTDIDDPDAQALLLRSVEVET